MKLEINYKKKIGKYVEIKQHIIKQSKGQIRIQKKYF